MIGQLKHGMTIGATVHTEFELREALTEDLFEAEKTVGVDTPITYSGALLCRQLVRIGDFTGPFTVRMLGKLKKADFRILRQAQAELDVEGED